MSGHDPQKVGEELARLRLKHPKEPLSDLADLIKWNTIPSCPSTTVGDLTAEAYKEELRNNPDKHAKEMLKAIEEGVEIGEDPSGN